MRERHEHATYAEPGVAADHVEAVATDPYDTTLLILQYPSSQLEFLSEQSSH